LLCLVRMKEPRSLKKSKLKNGLFSEDVALKWLLVEDPDLVVLARNYRKKTGEIDIIVTDKNKNEIIFIEVRSRLNCSWISPLESIGYKKRLKIKKTAHLFLCEYEEGKKDCSYISIRFDVVEVSGNEVTWIQDAF